MSDQLDLPLELERVIFELSAWNASKLEKLMLMLVARRVYEWIEPIFYEEIGLEEYSESDIRISQLASCFRYMDPANAGKVQSLYLCCPNVARATWRVELLPLFTNLQRLVISNDRFSNAPQAEDFRAIMALPLTHLTVGAWLPRSRVQSSDASSQTLPAYSTLTHLWVFGFTPLQPSTFEGLHALKHLCVKSSDNLVAPAAVQSLNDLPSLQSVIINNVFGYPLLFPGGLPPSKFVQVRHSSTPTTLDGIRRFEERVWKEAESQAHHAGLGNA